MIEIALTQEEVAKALGVTTRTLANWRQAGRGPEWFMAGEKLIRYWPAAVREWTERPREAASA